MMLISNKHEVNASKSITQAISKILGGWDVASNMGNISCLLAEYGRYGLAPRLSEIIDRIDELTEIARYSYLHGNGFLKIPLVQCDTHTLRLHVWRSNCDAEENLHSHRWPFASAVLLGTLKSEVWDDATDDGSPARVEMIYRGKNVRLEEFGECHVRLKEVCCHTRGDHYWLSADTLHRIVNAGEQLTVTLMAHPRNTRAWARNILLRDFVPNLESACLSSTPDDLKLVLSEVLSALAKPS